MTTDHEQREVDMLRTADSTLRKEGIIFQQEQREELALFFGLPQESFNEMNYEEWIMVRDGAKSHHLPITFLILTLTMTELWGVREAIAEVCHMERLNK